ncbi:hypothetical protein CDO52_00980 [Nocardiopsis gilva YIM 90087]|uniref:Uncharacterized protein n=1 Tax=Nocardiopsis gilva YIM 90087 TaxID=1235441 RepID=A0A223S089_9ACTN|nr:hypothetical protein [Nocardiopsis gilva]ASU81553.1 hypothetical protein CDO52_00980 [Nocardiopsis gilva YIM 90087]
MIRHTHAPDAAVGDRVDVALHGIVDEVLADGRLLVRYETTGGSHAWDTIDPAAVGIGVTVALHDGRDR